MERTAYHSSLGIRMSLQQIVQEIARFVREDNTRKYKIIIGSDSQGINNSKDIDFVTAIVVHRVGNGGRYFWRRVHEGSFFTLRDRIIQEVMFSLDAAKELLALLRALDIPHFDFEIHVDIGEDGATKSMLQEVLGMIRAYNFEARTKPQSYAATKVADRHV